MTTHHITPAVSLRGVSKSYGTSANPVHALRNIDVDIHRSEFTAIMGPSGSGKSTLMNVCAGLDDVTAGEVHVGGRRIDGLSDADRTTLRRSEIGFVFQSFNLVPTLTADENIRLPFHLAGKTADAHAENWIRHLVDTLGLRHRLSHHPAELSGGQQQRVAIVRALASRPAIILADEPTGNLDTRSSRDVLALLTAAAREYGQGIAMVTHDPVAAAHADRILVLADGAFVGEYRGLSPRDISDLLINLESAA